MRVSKNNRVQEIFDIEMSRRLWCRQNNVDVFLTATECGQLGFKCFLWHGDEYKPLGKNDEVFKTPQLAIDSVIDAIEDCE